jgi:hypothetical protein
MRLWRTMVEGSRSEGGQKDDLRSQRPTNTARIDRTARKVLISRSFMRSVLSIVYQPPGSITDRSRKYRLLIDRVGMWRFAGFLPDNGHRGRCGRYFLWDMPNSLCSPCVYPSVGEYAYGLRESASGS